MIARTETERLMGAISGAAEARGGAGVVVFGAAGAVMEGAARGAAGTMVATPFVVASVEAFAASVVAVMAVMAAAVGELASCAFSREVGTATAAIRVARGARCALLEKRFDADFERFALWANPDVSKLRGIPNGKMVHKTSIQVSGSKSRRVRCVRVARKAFVQSELNSLSQSVDKPFSLGHDFGAGVGTWHRLLRVGQK